MSNPEWLSKSCRITSKALSSSYRPLDEAEVVQIKRGINALLLYVIRLDPFVPQSEVGLQEDYRTALEEVDRHDRAAAVALTNAAARHIFSRLNRASVPRTASSPENRIPGISRSKERFPDVGIWDRAVMKSRRVCRPLSLSVCVLSLTVDHPPSETI